MSYITRESKRITDLMHEHNPTALEMVRIACRTDATTELVSQLKLCAITSQFAGKGGDPASNMLAAIITQELETRTNDQLAKRTLECLEKAAVEVEKEFAEQLRNDPNVN